MPDLNPFIDTNILLYLMSEDTEKADRAEEIVHAGGPNQRAGLKRICQHCPAKAIHVMGGNKRGFKTASFRLSN